MKIVTENQVQQLYAFTRAHFVEHYDLQTELVDHLANHIENQWADNPEIPFKDALNKAFKPFGIFGFQDVIAQKTNAMNKIYSGLIWNELKAYFKLPKIILLAVLIALFFTTFRTFPEYISEVMLAIMITAMIPLGIQWRKLYLLKKKRFKQTGKKFLLEDMIFSAGNMGALSSIVSQILFIPVIPLDEFIIPSILWNVAFFSVFISLFIVVFHIMYFVLPASADRYLQETYPEYKTELAH